MKNVYLFQPQYTLFINGKINNWLPYSAGVIWSYAAQFQDITENFELKELIYKREELTQLLSRLDSPAVCGFSCYVWNKQYCLAAAEKIKQQWPDCVIVFGGPEVSSAMTKHTFIDCILLGEGEENFVHLLRSVAQGQQPELFYNKKRTNDLNIPSPYLTGLFDNMIKNNPDAVWSATIETNRGCPYRCTFCDWGSLTYSKVKKFDLQRIKDEIEWLAANPIVTVYLADANFGIFKERDLKIAKMLRKVADQPTMEFFAIQASKNNTEIAFQIGQALGPKYLGVGICVQSMHEETLSAIKRKNMPINNIKELLGLAVKYNVPTYTEVILGMPKETKETWRKGLTDLLEIGQHSAIEMWFTQLLENSELNSSLSKTTYGIKSVVSKNYSSMQGTMDQDGIVEESEIICETNTMTTEEMVESYAYGWMIIQLHVAGYSQIVSKYLRYAKNISFREFYDNLIEQIQLDEFINPEYSKVKQMTMKLLTNGETDNGPGHLIHSISTKWLYDNKDKIMDFVCTAAEKLTDVPESIKELQHKFIFDETSTYPQQVTADFDLVNNTPGPVCYTISPNIQGNLKNYSSVVTRRKGILRNNLEINQP